MVLRRETASLALRLALADDADSDTRALQAELERCREQERQVRTAAHEAE